MIDKLPPQNIIAEQQILSAMLLNSSTMYDMISDLQPEDFYLSVHSNIFDTIKKYKTSDISVIATHVQGSETVLCGLLDIGAFRDVSKSVEQVRGCKCRRGIISACNQAISAAQNDFEREPAEIANEHHSVLYQNVKNENKFVPQLVANLLPGVFEDLCKQYQTKIKTGITTGIATVDEDLFIEDGDFVLIGARPSQGKSALASGITRYNALKKNKSVAVFSLEMRASTQLKRDLFSEANCNLFDFNKGNMPKIDFPKLSLAADPLLKSKYWLDCEPGQSPVKIRSKCNFIKSQSGLDLIVVDYVQLCQGDRKFDSERERVSYVALTLNEIAKEFGVPLIALSQLSRALEGRPDKRPNLGDLIESGALEAAADTVLFLYREEKYNRNTDKKNIAEIICAKQRNGRSEFRKEVYFHKETMNFRDIIKEDSFEENSCGRF